MGFSEPFVVDALRMFNNSKDEAVWTTINYCFKQFIDLMTLFEKLMA